MVKRTLETYECDICGKEGERFVVSFPDGTLTLDRCETHAKPIKALRDQKGAWLSTTPGSKVPFKLSTPDDIKRQKKS